jgi:glycosyltransferase involved in cell wall biosynthesis
MSVIPLGVDTKIFHPNPSDIGGQNIFHLSSSEARDMSMLMVRAYARALSMAPDLPDLVIGGDLGSQHERICSTARETGVDQRLHLLGRISDEELRRRYASAAMCVQPSQYEGFGLQPLEALACGAPLVILPEPAVEEVVGDVAVIARESNETSLAHSIGQLWHDKDEMTSLRKKGPERAALFSWDRTSTLLADLLVNVAHGKAVNPSFSTLS